VFLVDHNQPEVPHRGEHGAARTHHQKRLATAHTLPLTKAL
jgi:hypothetical protein